MTAARIAQLIIDHERRRERMRKGEFEPTPIEALAESNTTPVAAIPSPQPGEPSSQGNKQR